MLIKKLNMQTLTLVVALVFLPNIAVSESSDKNSDAMRLYNLGTSYWYGYGIEKNHEKACDYFEKSANSNVGLAQFNLGNCYRLGQGRKHDHQLAIFWYEKAVMNNVLEAFSSLGSIYIHSSDKKDQLRGAEMLATASDSGLSNATFMLGTAYYASLGVDKDNVKAIKLYLKAAENGHVLAQAILFHIYDDGLYGVDVDKKIANTWKDKVESNINISTGENWTVEYALAGIYKFGWGVPVNKEKSLEYLKLRN